MLSGATHVCLRKEVQFHTGKKEQIEPRVLVRPNLAPARDPDANTRY